MPPIHLLVVASNYSHTFGGVEAHLASLVPRLAERNVRVTVVHLGASNTRVREGLTTVWTLPRRLDFRKIIALPGPFALARMMQDLLDAQGTLDRVDVVATHTRFFPMSVLGVFVAKLLKVPLIHTEHGGGHVSTASRAVNLGAWVVDRTFGRFVLRRADKVLAVSRTTQRFVADLARTDALLLHNGIDLVKWIPHTAPVAGPRNLVFAGRLVSEKGWRTFLAVARECARRGWRGNALICGDGPDSAVLATELGTSGPSRACPLGRVSSAELSHAFNGAVYVNPSTAAEGFQLTLIEAVAAGAAVVTYAVGVSEEVASIPGADVTVVPRGDEEGLTEAAWRALGREVARPSEEALAEWDWSAVADEYLSALRSIVH